MTRATTTMPAPDSDTGRASWYLAYLLRERLAAAPTGFVDESRGRLRLDRWKQEPAFAGTSTLLGAWLDAHGLDETTFRDVLGETAEGVRDRFVDRPSFVDTIDRAWRDWRPAPASDDGGRRHGHPHNRFRRLTEPLIADGERRIRAAVGRMCAADPSPWVEPGRLADQLCTPPLDALMMLTGRVLVLELNIHRVEDLLAGSTAEERFDDFTDRLADPAYARSVLAQYPLMARDAVRIVDNWVSARVEFAERLIADLPTLIDRLGPQTGIGTVDEVGLGAGDSHRDGRSVGIVTFTGGARVVYKPRSLAVDVRFQHLLRWLNDRGAEPDLRTFWVVDRGPYGWTEFVATRSCTDRDQLRRFYARHGSYLAILHCLAAVDFHLENVIADGEHPVLIDLEALFHPQGEEPVDDVGTAPHAHQTMRDSVLSVGLLPRPILVRDDEGVTGVDFSGLAGAAGQRTPAPVATWQDAGTDRMCLVRQRIEMGGGQNLPSLDGAGHSALDFSTDLIDGFERTYRLLLAHRDALLAPDGPVAAFADTEVRVILRATRIYLQLIQESRHPDLLRNGLDRDRFFSYLWLLERWPGHNFALAAAEHAQLAKGDVPIFTTRPDSHDVEAGDGTLIAGVLTDSGLARARARIGELNEAHLRQQTWFLRGSLAALAIGEGQGRWPGYRVAAATAPAAEERFLTVARAAGDRLVETAAVGEDTVSWLGLTFVSDKLWQLGPVGIDLYSGVAGIALFLGYLGDATGEQRYRAVAEKAAAVLAHQIGRLKELPPETIDDGFTVGAFNELGGPLYALSHLGALWDRPDLLDAAAGMLPTLRWMAPRDRHYDVISGCAGALLAVLALHSVRPDDDSLDVANLFAEQIVWAAEDTGDGIGWRGLVSPGGALAGFSHGASGIAVALARLDRATGRRRYTDLVQGALRFERAAYDPVAGGWPDLRDSAPERYTLSAWCHGGPGIAMARADLLTYLDDDCVRADLDHAVAGVLRAGLDGDVVTGSGNHSICHGDLGNVEALLLAGQRSNDRGLVDRSALLAASVLASIEQDGWLCGVPLGAESPGLMSGLAGIGYNLLRLARPTRTPSVLLLDGPLNR